MLQKLKKLKIKLASINVVSIGIIFLIIFVSVYFLFEWTLIRHERTLLYNIALTESIPHEEEEPVIFEALTVEEEYLMMFSIKTDLSGEILTYSANIIHRPDFLAFLLELVVELAYEDGVLIKEVGDVAFFDVKFAYFVSERTNGVIYAFISTEKREEMLRNYIYIMAAGFITALMWLLFTSLFIAGKAIVPIRNSMETQEKFIADASHELRTPLAVIRSNVEMIMDEPELTVKENLKWLEYILKEAKRMAKITEDLLFLSNYDINKNKKELGVQKEKLNLSVLISGIYDSFYKLLEEHGLSGSKNIEQDIYIYANENQIRQLVTILLDNAIKYTKEGGVALELEQKEQEAYIRVIDTGQGIAEDMLEKIFERFVRTDKARSREAGGAGLGLSIARSIAKEHNGQITAASESGKGSVFCVRFPLCLI